MKVLKVKTQKPYNVYIGNGTIEKLAELISGVEKVFLLTDEKVSLKYGEIITGICMQKNVKSYSYCIKGGELVKSKKVFDAVINKMIDCGINKDDIFISFGGGTVSDIGGLVSFLYKRGIRYINIPTTLLSQADACIGGKSALDVKGIKNAIGGIYQPYSVIVDLDFLDSLSNDELTFGMAEIVKCALIGSKKLYNGIMKGNINLIDMIYCALEVKAELLKTDEFDECERKFLNFGHTVGHAIESLSNFSVSHGKAVAYGMIVESAIFEKYCLAKGVKDKVIELLEKVGITDFSDCVYSGKEIFEKIKQDKKAVNSGIYIPCVPSVGNCKLCFMNYVLIEEYFNEG